MRMYSCYFSNDRFEVFETQILLLEDSLSQAVGRSLIGGDSNSKSTEWVEARLDWRGILVGDLYVLETIILSDHRCIEFN